MTNRSRILWRTSILALLAVGCGTGASMGADVSGAQQQDYGTTKQMVVDILHSTDGQKAVQDVLKDPSTKQQLVVTDTDISKAVEKSLESSKNQNFLAEQAKDPKFAEALAKATQPELLALQKQLMKDPEYQKDMLVLLKSPDFTKNVQDLMKTPEYRGEVMKIMTDALNTPSFKLQFQDALKKAVADSMQQSGKQSGGSSSGGGGGSSSSGGGEGEKSS